MDSGIAISQGKVFTLKGVNFNGKMGFDGDNIFTTYYNVSTDGNLTYGGAYPSLKTSLNLSSSTPIFEIYGAPVGSAGDTISYTKLANFALNSPSWISSRGDSSDFNVDANGLVSIGHGMTVDGVITLLGTISYSGTSTFNSGLVANSSADFNGNITIDSATAQTVTVGTNTTFTFNQTPVFNDGATFNTVAPTFPAGITVSGTADFNGTVTFDGASVTYSAGTVTTFNNDLISNDYIEANNLFVSNGQSHFNNDAFFNDVVTFANTSPVTFNAGATFNSTVTGIDKNDVGLGNVDNTSDANKPISNATQTALNGKEASITAGTTAQYWRGDKTFQTLNTTAVAEGTNQYFTTPRVLATALTGLSTATNAVITATDTVLSAAGKLQNQITNLGTTVGGKANTASPTFTGTVTTSALTVGGAATFNSTADFNQAVTFDGSSIVCSSVTTLDLRGQVQFGNLGAGNGQSVFRASNQLELARIDNSGNGGRLVVLSPSNYAGWYVRAVGSVGSAASSIIIDNFGTGASHVGAQITWNSNTWTSVSDETEKDIIEPILNVSYKLYKLRTIIGKYKCDETNRRRPFLIAQDVQKDFPEVVDVLHTGKLGLRYTEMVPYLVAALNEHTEEITNLKQDIEFLKEQIKILSK